MPSEMIAMLVLVAIVLGTCSFAIWSMAKTLRSTFEIASKMWVEASRQALAISESELSRRKIEVEAVERIARARESVPSSLPGKPYPAPTVEGDVGYNDEIGARI